MLGLKNNIIKFIMIYERNIVFFNERGRERKTEGKREQSERYIRNGYILWNHYINKFCGGSIFVEMVCTSHPWINFLPELINHISF